MTFKLTIKSFKLNVKAFSGLINMTAEEKNKFKKNDRRREAYQ
jgi:hypothetical protein